MEELMNIGQITLAGDEEILTPPQAGAIFGVSTWAMYKRVKNGTAPGHRLGKKIYFFKSGIIAMILEN